jgi:hypothetical protein
MGMELRIREPSMECVAQSCLDAAPTVGLLPPELDWWAGVSRTSFRNCELFMVRLRIDCRTREGWMVGFLDDAASS